MRRLIGGATTAAAALVLALAAAAAARGGEPVFSAEEELRLARDSFERGLYGFAAMRLEELLKRDGLREADQVRLLLAESLYMDGRRQEALSRLEKFPEEHPDSRRLLECRVWIGRARTEFQGEHAKAEAELRPLLAELKGAAGLALGDRQRLRLVGECRYFLCLAMVEQERVELLDDSRGGGHNQPPRAGALGLLEEQVGASAGTGFMAEGHVLRGRALCLRGRLEECVAALQEQFLDKDIGRNSPGLRCEALFWQAEARYGQGRWEEAIDLYGRSAEAAGAAGREPWRLKALYGSGWARLKRARDLRRNGLGAGDDVLDAALADFDACAGRSGKLGDAALASSAALRAGEALVLRGRSEEAMARLEPLCRDAVCGVEAMMLAAEAATGLGQRDRARKLLDDACAGAPEEAVALRSRIEAARGRNAFARGDWDAAMLAFKRVIELSGARSGQTYEAELWIARTEAMRKDFPAARSAIGELLDNLQAREDLHLDRLYYHLGDVLLRQISEGKGAGVGAAGAQGDARTDAAQAFGEVVRISPFGEFAIPARFGAARAYLLMEPPSARDAMLQYEEVLKDQRADAGQREDAELGMARALQASRSYQKAAELLQERILEAKPGPSPRARREALRLRAECLEAGGEAKTAAAALAALAGDEGASGGAAEAHIRQARQLVGLGLHAEAAKQFETALGMPSLPAGLRAEVLFSLAEAEGAAGRPAEALKRYLEHAEMKGSRSAEARARAAQLCLDAGRHRDADPQARLALEALSASPERGAENRAMAARAALVSGRALLALGDAAGAVSQYRRAAHEASAAADLAGASAAFASTRNSVRELQLDALIGMGNALLKTGAKEDAAAGFLLAANLMAGEPDERIRGALAGRGAEALERAALALEQAGHPEAARQVSAVLESASRPAPEPSSGRKDAPAGGASHVDRK